MGSRPSEGSRWRAATLRTTACVMTAMLLPRAAVQAQQAGGEPPSRLDLAVRAATSPIRVDGVLDETAWNEALQLRLSYEWFPGDNAVPPVETDCLLTHDRETLYVAFRALDPRPEEIRAHLWDRDEVGNMIGDDLVGFIVDTFGDDRRGFRFQVSAASVQAEAILSGVGSGDDWSWDAIWEARARITEDGWIAEIAIPFNQLRFSATAGVQTWGFLAFRSWPRSTRHRMRSAWTDRDNSCLLCQTNRITGFEGISVGRNVELVPTLTTSRTDRRTDFPDGRLESGDPEIDPGFTGRWGITPSLTLNATANPDFSHVEADVAQLEVNERFALFFPEKRPFFLEGVDFFETPLQTVFTRTVADPSAGAKLTGKIGANALGLFVTRDRVNNLTLPSNQGSRLEQIRQDVSGAVIRYRRDVGADSTLGFLYTGREATGYHNRVVNLDGYVRLGAADTLRLQYVHSETAYPDDFADRTGQEGSSFSGNGWVAVYEHAGRDWVAKVDYRDLGVDLRADYGFIPRVDLRGVDADLMRIFRGEGGDWYQEFKLTGWVERLEDHDGRLTERSYGVGAEYTGPLQTSLFAVIGQETQLFRGEEFDLPGAYLEVRVRPTGGSAIAFSAELGDTLDVNNVRRADLVRISPSVDFNVGRHVAVRLSHERQSLGLEGEQILTESLSQARFQYMFNPHTFVRAILQYRRVLQNPKLFVEPVEEELDHLFTQFLFSYKLNPQTLVFVGYSDNSRGLTDTSLVRTDKTFFVKLGYAWLF